MLPGIKLAWLTSPANRPQKRGAGEISPSGWSTKFFLQKSPANRPQKTEGVRHFRQFGAVSLLCARILLHMLHKL